MLAKRFMYLLKILRSEDNEIDIDAQCRMMGIERKDLFELAKNDIQEIPEKLINQLVRGYRIDHFEFLKLQKKAGEMEWAEFCPHHKSASSLILRDLCCQGYSIYEISKKAFLPLDYLKRMCAGKAKETPGFFELVQDKFDYSSDKIDNYIKYFSRNAVLLRLRGYTLKQRNLIWHLTHMISWLTDEDCQKFMAMFEHVPAIDPDKQFYCEPEPVLYRYICMLKDDHGMTDDNIFFNKEIWSSKDLSNLRRGLRNLTDEQMRELEDVMSLGEIEKESLRHLNDIFGPEVVIKLSSENSSVEQYNLICDFCQKVRNFSDGVCDDLNDFLLDLRGSLEYIIPKTKSILGQQIPLLSPVFSFLVSRYGSDAEAASKMVEYLGYSLSTCYSIKKGRRAFTSEILGLYVQHFNMNVIEEELLRYFAFINERYAIVDLNNYSIRSRAFLNDFDQVFPHMDDNDFKEINDVLQKIRERVKKYNFNV